MKVLIACEFSGIVREAFRERGHYAFSCDLLDTEISSPYHYTGRIENLLKNTPYWDLLIAFPPCTYLCNSGVRWLYKNGKGNIKDPIRWELMWEAAMFFDFLLNYNKIPKRCLENPKQHGHAKLPKPNQIIQPWQFGHGETKATGLWLKNLPPLMSTNIVNGREGKIHKMPPSKDRGKLRSITYTGIAQAMAEQWG